VRETLFGAYVALRGRPLARHLREIEASQWLTREATENLQLAKLRAMLHRAARSVPYYAEIFRRAGFDPSRVSSPADLRRLPVLDRETLSARLPDLLSRTPLTGAMLRSTGGSTGRPVRFYVDQHERTTRSAHLYRNLRWMGWDLGKRAAYVWGSDADSKEHRGWRAALRDTVAGVLWLDAFTLHQDRLDEYLDRLQRFDPVVLIGYPSSLHILAERALATSRRFRLGGVQSSAEMLAPAVRRDLKDAFGGAVLDRYGCREAGVVAHECPEGAMHVNAEAVVMECEGGEVLLTTLNNDTMPLIRYRNEDLAEMSADRCRCGRGLPLVGRIQGRRSDVILSPSGKMIHGEFFTHLFYEAPGVRRFQVRQTRLEEIEINVVATGEFTPEARSTIERSIHAHADPGFHVVWNSVSEIPPGPSGKHRFTISDVRKGSGD
jgi:phenylacetate-CoA ligase